ncbi:hypothetical protein FGADI_9933 [Fusarium gaditjirri]|uniref:3-hydroxyisobutyrate dehydrogenase n=1 Tax=Fusarium gaditjirri TaxID=282569 RepID=A0A8H4SYQ4_9HYPO|nr:hypothetical protein FGADI_9933 [Fusarium gaditjirri]
MPGLNMSSPVYVASSALDAGHLTLPDDELPASRTVELPAVPFATKEDGYDAAPHAPKHTYEPSETVATLPRSFLMRSIRVHFGVAKKTLDRAEKFAEKMMVNEGIEVESYRIINMSSAADTIAFIGLGVMGNPMAVNLVKGLGSSKSFLVVDVKQEALNEFQDEVKGLGKVLVVQNGYEAAKAADTVITMLPTDTAVEAVYLDRNTGILAGTAVAAPHGNPAKKLLIECGTIETATINKIAKAAEEASSKLPCTLSFVDAPVSSGPMGAIDGSLTFIVGVPQAKSVKVFPQVEALLNHMGKSIFQCCDVGAGTAFKIINNYLSAITSVAAAEALNIGVKSGLDPKLLSDVINVSGGQCWVTSKANPVPGVRPNVPSSNGYVGGFRIELCEKVLQMGSMLAEDVGAKTVLDGRPRRLFRRP